MATIAELMIKLGMDDGGLDKGMSSSQSKLKSWGESLRSVGTKLTAGVTMPLVGAGLAAIKWASDLDESLSKTNVLFGDAADDVVKFSEGSAKALGFSQQATLDYASAYAGMLNTVAETDTELGDMSTTLTQLTSDFASFHNLNPGDAFTVIQSALAGETEAIRRYGVDVSAAAVETEALAMGLAATASELTEQDKLLARYNILMKQTAEEQGDFARTAKSTSNQLKILRARIQDVGARFGKFLLPYVNMAVDRLLDLIDRLEALDPKWQKLILAVAAFAAVLGPALIALGFMLPALGALATVIGFLLSPLGLLVIAIAALIGLGIYAFINDLWGVRDAVYAVVDALSVFRPVLTDIIDIFQAAREGDWHEVFDELKDAFISLGQALLELNEIVGEAVGELVGRLVDWATGYDWYGLLNSVGQALWDGMVAGFEAAWPVVSGWLSGLGAKINEALSSASDWGLTMVQRGSDLITGLLDGITLAWPFITTWASNVGPNIVTAVGDFLTLLVSKGADLLQGLLDGLAAKWPAVNAWLALLGAVVVTAVGDLARTLYQKGMDLLQGMLDGINDKWETVQAWLQLLGTIASSAVGDLIRTLYDQGMDLIEGLFSGIADNWESVADWLSELGSRAAGYVGDVSYSLFSAGWDLVSGVANGILAAADSLVSSAISYVVGLIEDGLSNIPGYSPIEHVGQYFGGKLGGGFAEGIIGAASDVFGASGSLVDAAIRPLDQSLVGNAGVYGGGPATVIYVSNSLKSQELVDLIRNAEEGGEFSRNFGSQMGLYAGMP